jgi:hypothetical protein
MGAPGGPGALGLLTGQNGPTVISDQNGVQILRATNAAPNNALSRQASV